MIVIKSEGNIMIAVVFIIFIFFVGAGLLTFSITHQRIVKARTFEITETGDMYQQLIYYLHSFREDIYSGTLKECMNPETDYFNSTHFPESDLDEGYKIKPSFQFKRTQRDAFEILRTWTTLDLTAGDPTINPYHLCAGITIDILAGKIPLNYIPVLVNANIDVPMETYFDGQKVENRDEGEMIAKEVDAELDFTGKILDSFNIPGDNVFIWRELREKLGLEPRDEPLPTGIYTVIEGTMVQAIFIQGDVSQIDFSIFQQDKRLVQVIRFTLENDVYELQYTPNQNTFYNWEPHILEDLYFSERIIVNGSVYSIKQEGEAAFTDLSNIQLLVTDKAIITDDLRSFDSPLTIDTAKMVNFTLAAGFDSLFRIGDETKEKGVEVKRESETHVDAAIISNGAFTNDSQKLNLTGSLYCKDLQNNGVMRVTHADSRDAALTGIPHFFTVIGITVIKQFFIHYIEEVSDE
jgi:hypothetical protein